MNKKMIVISIISFILGVILTSSIGIVIAISYSADKVTYTPKDSTWKVDNAKAAIDYLKTKVKPEYTGLTTITPNTNSQTLYTNNKILNNNIVVEPIPSSYKNLTTQTDVSSENLLYGIKAYTNDGVLVTGSISPNCISGSHVWTQNDSDNGIVLANFTPKYFAVTANRSDTGRFIYYYNYTISSTTFYSIKQINNSITQIAFSSGNTFSVSNNSFRIQWSSGWNGETIYYMACS